MITAEGKKGGKKLTVVYDKGEFLFNHKKNELLDREMQMELSERHAVGGTYYPEKKGDIINVLNVLENYFFDRPVTAKVENEEISTLESEPGVIY